ncbi:MAG: hypothetical protein JO354_13740 [Verrucomicrobia bacterium]|nr:hypothetical protein [Verrucomicrobiota bacterium]
MKNTRAIASSRARRSPFTTVLVVICFAAATFGAGRMLFPHFVVGLLLGAVILLLVIHELGRRAPLGYEDETGFHFARLRRA